MGQLHHDYFYNEFNELVALVDGWIRSSVPETKSRLSSAIRYSAESPGKRLRAVLAVSAANLLGFESERVRSFAVALELLHAGSLVHDDLPAIDNDDLRRGLPTAHRQFGEGVAILSGDALFARAFHQVAEDYSLPAETKNEMVRLLSGALLDLCDGQVLDLENGDLEQRHLKKTASLISVAASGSAKLLSLEEKRGEHYLRLSRYGYELGLLFQITDDILDGTKPSEVTGKTAGSDSRSGRTTYLSKFGEVEARAIAAKHLENAIAAVEPYGERGLFLQTLAHTVSTRDR